MPSNPTALPSIGEPQQYPSHRSSHSSVDSSATASEDDTTRMSSSSTRLQRPKIGSRKSSGTMIVPREGAASAVDEGDYGEDDVRTMSPRRSSEEVDQLGEEARRDMMRQAQTLQASLQAIVERVESVKSEHEKLEGGNKFLQSYIGELMQTSKITSSGANKSKGKGRK